LRCYCGEISITVAAIPEALPAVITTSLAAEVSRMAKRHAIVKTLPSAETLGAVTVICSDKTGTLTKGEMSIRELYLYDLFLDVQHLGKVNDVNAENSSMKSNLYLLAKMISLCNDAKVIDIEEKEINEHKIGGTINNHYPQLALKGDPTEVALASFSYQILKITKQIIDKETPRIFEIPFTSEGKLMTTVHTLCAKENSALQQEQQQNNQDIMTNRNRKNIKRNFEILVVTKGAPEAVIEKCDRIQAGDNIQSAKVEYQQEIIQANNVLVSKGLRVLGVAFKRLSVDERIYKNIIENTSTLPDSIGFEQNLVFLGLVALTDPPRKEAIRAISQCKSAGIKVIMITGDNKITAESIAREMGISSPDPLDYENTNSENMLNSRIPDASGASVLTGSDIDALSDEELEKTILKTKVYSRVLPEHKLRIVRALKKRRYVVAVTGDGVNDAPVLKAADIGIAMGITGTQVAKEVILNDDNFATIVEAIKEGRKIVDNINKCLVYLISTNLGEIMLLSSAMIVGLPTPLLAKQILYVNLATDGSPAIALGTEPSEPDIMNKPPSDPRQSIFSEILNISLSQSIPFYFG